MYPNTRSSHWEVFWEKDVLQNFAKFTEMHLCQGLFLIKLQASDLQLYWKRGSGTYEFCKIFQNTCFLELLRWLLCGYVFIWITSVILRFPLLTLSMYLFAREGTEKLLFSLNPWEMFIWNKSSHPGETSHLSEILAEWCISLCKSKSFIWEWIHPTQLRSHVNAVEISLSWDEFSPSKQFLPDCPTLTGLFI